MTNDNKQETDTGEQWGTWKSFSAPVSLTW